MYEYKDLSGNVIKLTREDVINAFNTNIEELIQLGKIKGRASGTDYNYVYQNKVYGPKILLRCVAYNTNQKIDNFYSDKSLRNLFDKLGFERQEAEINEKNVSEIHQKIENSQKEIERYIKKYSLYKQSSDYSEQYKYNYADKYKGIFDDMSDFADKIRNIEIHNFAPFFISMCSGLKHLINHHLEDLNRALAILLSDGDLKNRIIKFKKLLNEQLEVDTNWRNNKILVDVHVASFFLFTNDYEKNLLFTEMKPYNKFAKKFNLNELSNYNSEEDRYINWQNFCLTELLPIMDKVLNKKHTLLDTQDFIRFIGKNNEEDQSNDEDNDNNKGDNMTEPPLNQILYGPPGTGKTYNTIIEAIKILNKELYDEYEAKEKPYKDLKSEFEKLKQQGKIEFVTFHQSYSYEEFVEGIKPSAENGNITYNVEPGIFRKVCNNAEKSLYQNKNNTNIVYANFNTVFNDFKETYPAGSDFEKLRELKYSENIIEYKFGNQPQYRKIDLSKIRKLFDDELKYDSAIEFNNDYDGNYSLACYHFAFYRELDKIRTEINSNVLNKIIKNDNEDYKINENAPNYVLIIDEINRGNISKIFGELITLIEDDKRGELKVRLPYSQKDFTVPKNLYIIGTMNTSDRSIASIDIALRRRFKFKEMMPRTDIEGFRQDFKEKFEILNRRISFLLDRDHQIGHSYFLNNDESLENIWFDSVMPLLNEYFYGDWEKLQNILGAAEDEKNNSDNKYHSFIKKIYKSSLNLKGDTSCLDEYYFDFVPQENIDFEKALENAFGKQGKKTDSEPNE